MALWIATVPAFAADVRRMLQEYSACPWLNYYGSSDIADPPDKIQLLFLALILFRRC